MLVKKLYDPTAQKFVHALRLVLGHADPAVAAQSYTFALGALISVIGRDGRIERLMSQADKIQDTEVVLKQLVTFCVGGVTALAQAAQD